MQSNFAIIRAAARPERARLSGAFGLTVVSGVCGVFSYLQFGRVLDGQTNASSLVLAASLSFGAFLAGMIASLVFASAAAGTAASLRATLANHVLSMPTRRVSEMGSGELIDRVDDDINEVARSVSEPARVILLGTASGVTAFVVLIAMVPGLAAAVAIATAILVIGTRGLMRTYAAASLERERGYSELNSIVEEGIAARDDLRANSGQTLAFRRFLESRVQLKNMAFAVAAKHRNMFAWVQFVTNATIVGIPALLVWLVVNGTFEVGEATAFALIATLTFSKAQEVIEQLSRLQSGISALARVGQLLQEPTEADTAAGQSELVDWTSDAQISIRNLTYTYASRPSPALDNVSLELNANTSYGIVGRTGAGKSTLVRLLSRLEDPARGSIFIQDVDLLDIDRTELRSHLAFITQRTDTFDATLHENVSLFDPSVSREAVEEAFAQLGVTDWLATLPKGVDTRLGPRGVELSAGESQLVAFARVLVRHVPIVILDEATSRLDPVTENLIHTAFDRLAANRTVIVIAHRLHTLSSVDQIVVMADARVVESGARDEMATRIDGAFNELLEISGANKTSDETDAAPQSLVRHTAPSDDAPTPSTSIRRKQPRVRDVWRTAFNVLLLRPRWFLMSGFCWFVGSGAAITIGISTFIGLDKGATGGWDAALPWFMLAAVAALVRFAAVQGGITLIVRGWSWINIAANASLLDGQLRSDHREAGVEPPSTGEAMARVPESNNTIELVDHGVDVACGVFTVAVLAFFTHSLIAVLIGLAVILIPIGCALVAAPAVGRRVLALSDARARLAQRLASVMGSIVTIKVFGTEKFAYEAIRDADAPRTRAFRRERILTQSVLSIASLTTSLGEITAILALANGNVSREVAIVMLGFCRGVTYFGMIGSAAILRGAAVRSWLRRFNPLLASDSNVYLPVTQVPSGIDSLEPHVLAPTPRVEMNEIELRNVSLVKSGTTPILEDVNLRIRKGEFVVVCGRIGAGKSTLLRIFGGLDEPSSGELLINGTAVANTSTVLRPPNSAWVSQVPMLLSGTFEENITLDQEIDLTEAISLAQLERDVTRSGGVGTMIGYRGIRLSGGQVQRVALARALAQSNQLLVCDDVSSALDVETEVALWRDLRDAKRTVIASSYKRVAAELADRVVVLDQGRIVDEDVPDVILARYPQLFS